MGLATHLDIANVSRDDPLALPRLDTNDLPKDEAAPLSAWTQRVHVE